MRKKFATLLLLCFLSLGFSRELKADFFQKMFGNTIATFTDVAKMIYYSFHPREMMNNKREQENHLKRKNRLPLQEIRSYLKSQGIDIPLNSRPIARQEFATILFQRFKFKKSFLTRMLKTDYFYFRDAKDIGIFDKNDSGNDTLTTKEMLKAYFKAFEFTGNKIAH